MARREKKAGGAGAVELKEEDLEQAVGGRANKLSPGTLVGTESYDEIPIRVNKATPKL